MAEKTISGRIRIRTDTAVNWENKNPTLLAGEIGIESDTTYCKVGDGKTDWKSLKYKAVEKHIHDKIIDKGRHTELASGTTANAPTSGMADSSGLYVTRSYKDVVMPANYGNVLNIAGEGTGQLFLEWSGYDSRTGHLYYRSHRNTNTGGWGRWEKIPFVSDDITGNASSATKATQDASGNVITATYATKMELQNVQTQVTQLPNILLEDKSEETLTPINFQDAIWSSAQPTSSCSVWLETSD